MESPEERVNIAITESERLKEYLGSLPTEAWIKPSACDRWEVRDVVAHMAWIAENYTERIHRSLQGDSLIPEGQPDPNAYAASFAPGNAQTAISRRESVGDQVFSDFVQRNDELNRLMTTLGPDDWHKPHYYASIGIEPMRYRPDLWISELAVHGWDIRSGLNPEAHLSDESLPATVDITTLAIPRWAFSPSSRLPAPLRYRWELTGPGARNSDFIVEGDKADTEPAGTGKADVTFDCDTETFVVVGLGRLRIDTAIATNRLSVQGDNKLALDFEHWFTGG